MRNLRGLVIPLLFILVSLPVHAGPHSVTRQTTVSLTVGGSASYTIFGYTSPKADVSLHGIGISDQTTAREDGYFAFENQFSPFRSHEACITARDQFGRLTPEVCLAPFPVKYNVSIGPVIMPPTISLDKPLYYISDEVILTGQTIPNTDVNISSFTKPGSRVVEFLARLNPVQSVDAYAIPKVDTKADGEGNFSFALPSSSATSYRLFSQTTYEDAASPKSLTLNLTIYPVWYVIILYFKSLLGFLLSHLVEVIILTNCLLLIVYLIRLVVNPGSAIRYHELMKRTPLSLILSPHRELMIREETDQSLTVFKEEPHSLSSFE